MIKKLTIKQEKFCQAYIRLGDKSAAYREAYNTSKMLPASINRKAFELFENVNIRSRVEQLQRELVERNKITVDELVQSMAGMVRFDLSTIYNPDGSLMGIHDMPETARRMISEMESFDEFEGRGENKVKVGISRKVKIIDKLAAIEKLMKHLGGYEKDNTQKAPTGPMAIQVEIIQPNTE